jgi:hypothetical protein
MNWSEIAQSKPVMVARDRRDVAVSAPKSRPVADGQSIADRPSAETLWRCNGLVLQAIASDRDYRDAMVAWFAEHGINAWRVVDAAITADERIGPRLEVLAHAEDERGMLTGGHTHLVAPLIHKPPEPHAGWSS